MSLTYFGKSESSDHGWISALLYIAPVLVYAVVTLIIFFVVNPDEKKIKNDDTCKTEFDTQATQYKWHLIIFSIFVLIASIVILIYVPRERDGINGKIVVSIGTISAIATFNFLYYLISLVKQ